MRLQWVGQTCFHIEARDGRSLLIDPYQRVIGIPRGNFPANVVVFTHNHIDHCDPSAVPPGAAIVMGQGHHEVAGFRLFGVRAFHDSNDGLLSGEVTLFSITVDGFRLVHLSDLGEHLSDEKIRLLGRPDVLLFPAGEHTTISLDESASLIERFAPAVAIPMAMHLPGLIMPAAPVEKVLKLFPNHRRAKFLELMQGQRLATRTEIRILDAVAYPQVGAGALNKT